MEDNFLAQGLSSSELKHGANVDEFRSSLHNMELQLAKTKEEKALISSKLEEVNEVLDRSQRKIQKTEAELHEKSKKIKDLEFKLEQATRTMPQGNIDLMSFHHNLKMKDEQIAELKSLLNKKDEIIESLKTHTYLDDQRLRSLKDTVEFKAKKAQGLKVKLEESKKSIDSLSLSKRNEATIMIELDHYKQDNARLISLLKSTKEFKNFSDYAEASEGIRYLPRTSKTQVKASDECDDWVPRESWKMVKDFLAKYGEKGFKSVQINQLLEDLNYIWRRREKNLMNQVRSKCNREIEKLRRQVSNAPKYDQYIADKNISRLKDDLKKAYEDLRTVSSASVRAIGRPHGFN